MKFEWNQKERNSKLSNNGEESKSAKSRDQVMDLNKMIRPSKKDSLRSGGSLTLQPDLSSS